MITTLTIRVIIRLDIQFATHGQKEDARVPARQLFDALTAKQQWMEHDQLWHLPPLRTHIIITIGATAKKIDIENGAIVHEYIALRVRAFDLFDGVMMDGIVIPLVFFSPIIVVIVITTIIIITRGTIAIFSQIGGRDGARLRWIPVNHHGQPSERDGEGLECRRVDRCG